MSAALYYGQSAVPLAWVVPDAVYSGLWRVRMPEGRLSDMLNLARAKDAAVHICARGPPVLNPCRFRWGVEPRSMCGMEEAA
jgi:hypothetical protein